jgi:exopolysaccharide production protein ExoQ
MHDGTKKVNMSATFSTGQTSRRPSERASGNSPLMRFLFAGGLVFLFPAFIYQLAVNHISGDFTGSRILQAANLACSIYAIVMIATSRQPTEIAKWSRPLIILVGLAFVSAAWSFRTAATLQASMVLLSTTLFGAAMATRLSPVACVQLIIRTMTLGCLMSVIWVVVFPDSGVHQLTDAYQTVHAGLWRGIFSHKQGLGVFAGWTTGLLLFYGSICFSILPIRVVALACSITCLIGTQSATGILTACVAAAMLYATYWIARRPPQMRKSPMIVLIAVLFVVYAAQKFGLLDFIPDLFGKSTDLSGRADFWPYVMDRFKNSGSTLLGGGLGSDYAVAMAPGASVDNGYIDKLIEFGYVGSAIVFATYGWIVWAGIRLILTSPSALAATTIFPANVMFALLFINISESNFMSKNIGTVLVAVAVCQIGRQRNNTLVRGRAAAGGKVAAIHP